MSDQPSGPDVYRNLAADAAGQALAAANRAADVWDKSGLRTTETVATVEALTGISVAYSAASQSYAALATQPTDGPTDTAGGTHGADADGRVSRYANVVLEWTHGARPAVVVYGPYDDEDAAGQGVDLLGVDQLDVQTIPVFPPPAPAPDGD